MQIRIQGGQPLNGVYTPSGNGNAAMALIGAALLTEQPVTLYGVPDTANIRGMIETATTLGAELDSSTPNTLRICAPQIARRTLTPTNTSGLSGMMLFLAAMLTRRQFARIETDFPLARLHTHLEALRDLGQDISTSHDALECRAVAWDKKEIILTQTSVTATALVLMLAARLGKETIIHNAACEPHILELAHLLGEMGVHIEGGGSNLLRVISPPALDGASATIGQDYIEAASIAALAALSGGRVQINGVRAADMRMIGKVYAQFGITLDCDQTALFIPKHEALTAPSRDEDVELSVETSPWPAFPSDLIAIATVIATQVRGTTLIHEKLFNNRLLFVDKLKSMGAQIVLCDPHRAIVMGATPLHGIYMDTPDVRTGAGMVAAALIAHGRSVIDNAEVVERQFANLFSKLQALGANITLQ